MDASTTLSSMEPQVSINNHAKDVRSRQAHRPLGYSGSLTAEHIAANFPSELKWAVAGRSLEKLQTLAAQCKELAPGHVGPGQTFVPMEVTSIRNTDSILQQSKSANSTTKTCLHWRDEHSP